MTNLTILELLAFSRLANLRGITLTEDSLDQLREVKCQFLRELKSELKSETRKGLDFRAKVRKLRAKGLPASEARDRVLAELLILMANGEGDQ